MGFGIRETWRKAEGLWPLWRPFWRLLYWGRMEHMLVAIVKDKLLLIRQILYL